MYDKTFEALLRLLLPLADVRQTARHHPEGDALNHSLQVFEHAMAETEDPILWAAALLHDVGKGLSGKGHAEVGAELLGEHVCRSVSWLVEHHLDLLHRRRETLQAMAGHPLVGELVMLRKFDLAGRAPGTWVQPVERALGEILQPGVAERWLSAAAIREDGLQA